MQEVDIAAGAISITPWREKFVDFSLPFMKSGISTIMKKISSSNKNIPLIRSPYELANQTIIKYGMISGSLTYSYFQLTNQSQIHAMWETMTSAIPPVLEWSALEGVNRVRQSNGRYAFFVESVFAEYISIQRPCDLRILGEYLNTSYYAFAVKKRSPLLDKLNDAITTLIQNGSIERLRDKWWKGKCRRRSSMPRGKKRNKKKYRSGPVNSKTGSRSISSVNRSNTTKSPSVNKQTVNINQQLKNSAYKSSALSFIPLTLIILIDNYIC